MGRDDAGPADEAPFLDRRHHQGRVLLGHADRIAVHIGVDDQVADHQHPQARHALQRAAQARDAEPMALGVVVRFVDPHPQSLGMSLQEGRGQAHLAGTEQQLAAIGLDGGLLRVLAGLIFLALDDDVRPQPRHQTDDRLVERDHGVDHFQR